MAKGEQKKPDYLKLQVHIMVYSDFFLSFVIRRLIMLEENLSLMQLVFHVKLPVLNLSVAGNCTVYDFGVN